jgi:glyoxylase-like metal-dependent hydrolase (beta-lactamase superfamily II)
MKIHALSTGTVRIKSAMRQGRGRGLARQINTLLDRAWTEPLPIYVWVIEHPEGVIVVDTGELASAHDLSFARFDIRPEDEIGPQLQRLGISPGDVRKVILTHLHGDHMDGMCHFPNSEILVGATEYQNMQGWRGWLTRSSAAQPWPDWFAPTLVALAPVPHGAFSHSHAVTASGDVVLVPTPGHTRGHMSVVVSDGGVSYFLAGDASYTQQLLINQQIDGVGSDPAAALQTLRTILRYAQERPTVYLPAHDPAAAQRLAAQTILPMEARSSAALPSA